MVKLRVKLEAVVNICKLIRAFFLNYFVVAGKFGRTII